MMENWWQGFKCAPVHQTKGRTEKYNDRSFEIVNKSTDEGQGYTPVFSQSVSLELIKCDGFLPDSNEHTHIVRASIGNGFA